jgi:hypothetical protein
MCIHRSPAAVPPGRAGSALTVNPTDGQFGLRSQRRSPSAPVVSTSQSLPMATRRGLLRRASALLTCERLRTPLFRTTDWATNAIFFVIAKNHCDRDYLQSSLGLCSGLDRRA